jgi:hypothetical protein
LPHLNSRFSTILSDPNVGGNPNTRGLLKRAPDKVDGKTVWEFTIPAGTGSEDWNTAATYFDLKPGEVFRIKTEEEGHGFHTDNIPCRHGGDRQFDDRGSLRPFSAVGSILVGGSIECDIGPNAIDTTAASNNPKIYDHIKGPGAQIYMRVTP